MVNIFEPKFTPTLVSKILEIDMGHRVPNHKSKCRNLHGHRYKIEVGVYGNVITEKGESDEGMVIDFGDLKEMMVEKIHEMFDHGLVLYDKDEFAETIDTFNLKTIFVDFIPTAENLAKLWFQGLVTALELRKIKLSYVKVWETPSSTATYTIDNYLQENL